MILTLIVLYILHIFVCRLLYKWMINIDDTWEDKTAVYFWVIPVLGLLVHILILLVLGVKAVGGSKWLASFWDWFIPKTSHNTNKIYSDNN